MTKKKIAAPKTTTTALAALPEAKLAPLFGTPLALEKLPGSGGDVTREEGVTLVTGRAYATRDRTVPASEVFFVDGARPRGDGPWLGEADKLSWRDEETGLECIMLRDTGGGHLCGYIGVPRDHPLWGWDHDAVPAEVGIEVHGGLTYSRICAEGPSPARRLVAEVRRICHVPPRYMPLEHATDHRPGDAQAASRYFAQHPEGMVGREDAEGSGGQRLKRIEHRVLGDGEQRLVGLERRMASDREHRCVNDDDVYVEGVDVVNCDELVAMPQASFA